MNSKETKMITKRQLSRLRKRVESLRSPEPRPEILDAAARLIEEVEMVADRAGIRGYCVDSFYLPDDPGYPLSRMRYAVTYGSAGLWGLGRRRVFITEFDEGWIDDLLDPAPRDCRRARWEDCDEIVQTYSLMAAVPDLLGDLVQWATAAVEIRARREQSGAERSPERGRSPTASSFFMGASEVR